ncbi:MAG: FKBP-type peptidyl-prolyl cis-trans isomerase, partial [Jiangellaceae bacterium]
MRRTSALTAILLAATLALAACGSDSGDSTTGDSGVTVTGEPGVKPTLEIPDSEPSSELEVEVIEEGDGAEVGTDDFVVAHYLGQTWEPVDGEANIFDNSYDREEASGFSLNGVIEGWKEGLTGQKVGSRVLLSIPPEQGYGDQDSGSIPANST